VKLTFLYIPHSEKHLLLLKIKYPHSTVPGHFTVTKVSCTTATGFSYSVSTEKVYKATKMLTKR